MMLSDVRLIGSTYVPFSGPDDEDVELSLYANGAAILRAGLLYQDDGDVCWFQWKPGGWHIVLQLSRGAVLDLRDMKGWKHDAVRRLIATHVLIERQVMGRG